MAEILADENISRSVVDWLRRFGFHVVRTQELGLRGASDRDVIEAAIKDGRIILTLDIDFARLYYHMRGLFGVIIVRIHPPTPERVIVFLEKLLAKVKLEEHARSLIIVSERRVEIIRH